MLAVALLGEKSVCRVVGYLHLRPPQVFPQGFVAGDAPLSALQSALVTPLVIWGCFLPLTPGCSGI